MVTSFLLSALLHEDEKAASLELGKRQRADLGFFINFEPHPGITIEAPGAGHGGLIE